MINHEVSQRNALPYLIALGVIILAFLLGWMANEVLQTAGLQVNIGSAPSAAPSTEIHPADRKYFNSNYSAPGSASARIDSAPFTEIHPADRKLFNTNYTAVGSSSAGVEFTPSTEIHPADRKFFKTIYTAVGSAPAGIESTPAIDSAGR